MPSGRLLEFVLGNRSRSVDGARRRLALVMLLPLVDGIFVALLVSGALGSVLGILEIGILVFGGSAVTAIVLGELDGSLRERVATVTTIGVVLVCGSALVSVFATSIESMLDMRIFERFAAVVIGAIAAETASARIREYLPRPAVIVGLGLMASLDPAGAAVAIDIRTGTVARAVAAGAVGVGFAMGVAILAPTLRNAMAVDRFRFGCATALGVLGLTLLGIAPAGSPLVVLLVAAILAVDPGESGNRSSDRPESDDRGPRDGPPSAEFPPRELEREPWL